MSSALNEEQFPIVPAIGFTLEKLWAERSQLLWAARFPFATLLLCTMGSIALGYFGADQALQSIWLAMSIMLALFLLAPICIRWNRSVILGESVNEPGPVFPDNTSTYVVTQIMIALIMVAVAVVATFPMTVFAAAMSGGQPSDQLVAALTPLIIVIAFGLTARLNIMLAAVAVKDQSVTIRQAWDLTQGNGLRLATGFLIILAVGLFMTYLLGLMISPLLSAETPITVRALASALSIAEGIVINLVVAGYFARAYLHFRGRSGPPEATD